jgi:hypothetical protein
MMAESSGKKQLFLRFKKPENFPDVARFVDDDFDVSRITNGEEEWNLQYEQEQLKEEEVDSGKKDEEFYRRKRRQRRFYKRKQTLGLTNAKGDMHMESKPVSLDSAEEHDENLLQRRLDPSSVEDVPFRHVLLQFVKRQFEGGEQTEIHVIPVADVYAFRKKLKQKDQLLSELDVAYAAQKEEQKKQQERYRRLLQGKNDPNQEDSEKKPGKGRNKGDTDNDTFTFAVNRALNRKRGVKLQQPTSILNENGLDLEELQRENEFLGGDYNLRFADDEEDHIHIMQRRMEVDEGEELADKWRPEDEEMDAEDEDGDNEEEEEEGADGEKKKDISTEEAVSAVALLGSKNLKEAELQAARNFSMTISNKAMKREPIAASSNIKSEATDTAAVPAKSAMKRSRDDVEDSTIAAADDGKESKRVRFPSSPAESSDATMMPPPAPKTTQAPSTTMSAASSSASSSATSSAAAKNDFELSMDGVRRFIRNQGGKVRTNILLNAFKAKMKAHSKQLNDKNAGNQLFLSIVDALTDTVEDPILGPVLSLKAPANSST